jgi:diketogulonate reductase-like aldo/keto reductase
MLHMIMLQGITCEAYGPLGHSKTDLLAHPEVTAVAKEVDRSPAQVRCVAAPASCTAH